jgi:hypothetical protein
MSWPSRRCTPPGELGHAGIEVDGVFLPAVIGEFQNLADPVDQKPTGFAAQVDNDRDRRLAVIVPGQAEAGAHVSEVTRDGSTDIVPDNR